ncbi:hypothetical protein V6N11_048719 [Hibiscus sabdariffa]|uniref:Uncharacterized protein n=1 Tax=Hibiscus sabdariffa TaxID=183260 RepID=A0ABR2PW17_9ROSI
MGLVMWIPIELLIPDRFTISETATTFRSIARSGTIQRGLWCSSGSLQVQMRRVKNVGTSANAVCVVQVNAPGIEISCRKLNSEL